MKKLLQAHQDHKRGWDQFLYVYPVISRRSQGVSIGINLNPDKKCNFDCIYCEVDRATAPRVKEVHLDTLAHELRHVIDLSQSGELFAQEPFAGVPLAWRRLNDLAFSGDGEPTTCPVFFEAVQIAYALRNELLPPEVKLILITDAACLDRPGVQKALELMRQGAYSVWAKLDAGTATYYQRVNRTRIPFERILENLTYTAQRLPITIQSLFMKIHGQGPSNEEIESYCQRILEIQRAGGQIEGLQIYTIARPTTEKWATALTHSELDQIAAAIGQRLDFPQQIAYGR